MSGVVIRDHTGEVKVGTTKKMDVCEPVEGEAQAAYTGAVEAKRRGFRDIILESDSLQVVEATIATRIECTGRSMNG